ncbi:retron Ec67 family RNA-directed DNA polymerase/endonuclease [Pseudomonas chlororaphis]|uniref:retron Ec67 family RNA-directed DNA polymerase/endonuclease n=1 Tax=Pseudomonas chlororaphis TaxID=587753 RepID=UPI0035310023
MARILNYEPKLLSYILYVKRPKYTSFTIPKSSGAPRNIAAPCEELKALQKKVKLLLDSCLASIELQGTAQGSLAHGFKKDHSIITNAEPHKRRRFVFNIDISDFFGSIHIGRVRGFLIANKSFQLAPKVATILAQIMCYEDALPQGAPTSPVASNLIGHLIDIRLVNLAAKYGCTYSRYADDITFSTNKKEFPSSIAIKIDEHDWIPGNALLKIIYKCGFSLNHNKTRMQYSESQQTVTGLIVNKSVNAPAHYRRQVRAMLHKLFLDGEYHRKDEPTHQPHANSSIYDHKNLEPLGGMLSYLYMISSFKRENLAKNSKIRNEDMERTSLENLHGDFLFYKNFYANKKPTIVCEGKTDNVYLSCAIKSLHKSFKKLAKQANNKTELKVSFLNYSKLTHRILNLNGGTADIASLIRNYAKKCGKFKAHPPVHPTIIVVDNDSGSDPIFKAIKEATGKKYEIPNGRGTTFDKSRPIYYIAQNLYVVLTPLKNGQDTMMEDFFSKNTLKTKVEGRYFEVYKKGPAGKTYNKNTFAQKVIKAQQKRKIFNGFKPILVSISSVLADYSKQKP